jgi:hypothetical protein
MAVKVYYTTEKDLTNFVKFRDEYKLEDGLVIRDLEKELSKFSYQFLRDIETYSNVSIFLNKSFFSITAVKGTCNLYCFEKVSGIQFEYINYKYPNLRKKFFELGLNQKKFKNLDLRKFVEDNLEIIDILTYSTLDTSYYKKDFKLNVNNIFSKSRQRYLVFTRQIIIYILREVGGNVTTIAKLIDLDHTTIVSSLKIVNNYLEIYARDSHKNLIEQLKVKLKETIETNE